MQISKWGNSLAIRIPAIVVEALQLKEGDDIEIRLPNDRAFEIIRKPGKQEFLDRLRQFRGQLPPDFTFNRDAANER